MLQLYHFHFSFWNWWMYGLLASRILRYCISVVFRKHRHGDNQSSTQHIFLHITAVMCENVCCISWRIKDRLDVTCYFISLLMSQHVSDINISIMRSLRLFCWITTLVVLFLVQCVLEIRCGWVWVVSVLQAEACNTDTTPTQQAEACNTDTTPTQPHRISNTHRTKKNRPMW